MSGFPSMTALLGLVAVAGYQNRDKLAELVGGVSAAGTGTPGQNTQQGGLGGLLGGVSGGVGGLLGGGIGDLIQKFKQNGLGDLADSWVQHGPNKPTTPQQVERGIGADVLETLSGQTGMAREEILARLSRELPDAIDKYTPNGRLPALSDYPRT